MITHFIISTSNPFSSQFYSLGSIEKINVDQLRNKLINKEKLRIIVEKSEINKLDSFIIERLIEIDDTGKKTNVRVRFLEIKKKLFI